MAGVLRSCRQTGLKGLLGDKIGVRSRTGSENARNADNYGGLCTDGPGIVLFKRSRFSRQTKASRRLLSPVALPPFRPSSTVNERTGLWPHTREGC